MTAVGFEALGQNADVQQVVRFEDDKLGFPYPGIYQFRIQQTQLVSLPKVGFELVQFLGLNFGAMNNERLVLLGFGG